MIKLKDLLFEKTLYHGTTVDNVEDIKKYGLIPQRGDFVSTAYSGEYNTDSDFEQDVPELKQLIKEVIQEMGASQNGVSFETEVNIDLRAMQKGQWTIDDVPVKVERVEDRVDDGGKVEPKTAHLKVDSKMKSPTKLTVKDKGTPVFKGNNNNKNK